MHFEVLSHVKKVAFLLDPDPGHIYPVLGLSESLSSVGYDIHMLGLADVKTMIGFSKNYHTVFDDLYPPGFLVQYKEMQRQKDSHFLQGEIPRPHLSAIANGALSSMIAQIDPDLLILPYSLSPEACLLRAVYPNLNVALFTTWLRPAVLTPQRQALDAFLRLPPETWRNIQTGVGNVDHATLCRNLERVAEIIPCPTAFEIPNRNIEGNIFNVGPLLRAQQHVLRFADSLAFPPGNKIVYCSLGSQTSLFRDQAKRVFDTVYQCFVDLMKDDISLLLNVGDGLTSYKPIAGKIQILNWVPQIEILKRTSLMITHGGLGTIKECIVHEVPMITIPMIYDQFENANRVHYHGLGSTLLAEGLTTSNLAEKICFYLSDTNTKKNINQMHKAFQEAEAIHLDVIGTLINRKTGRN